MSAAARAAPSVSTGRYATSRPISSAIAAAMTSGVEVVEVHAAPGSVAPKAVPYVEVLLEVVTQWEVEERPPVRRQLHRRRQPALDDGEVAGCKVTVELVDVRMNLQPVDGRQRRGVDPRPRDDDHPQRGHPGFRLGERRDHAPQEVDADTRASDRDDAHLLVGPVAQLGPKRCAVREDRRVEPRDVAGEVVVGFRPRADQREVGAERVGDDVVRVADEDRAVAHSREPRDVLDHLGVVVGRHERLPLVAVRHREPADEVGQPDVGGALLLGVLVEVVVDLPRLVADPEVVLVVAHDVVEEHEVRAEDLVHAPDRLERVEVVLGALALDVAGLVREQGARRVDSFALGLEHVRHRALREPVDFEIGDQRAKLVRDRDVAPSVAEPDRRRDVERAPTARLPPAAIAARRHRRSDRLGELAQELVDLHGVAHQREVTRTLERDERPTRRVGERNTPRVRLDPVTVSVDDQHGAAHVRGVSTDGLLAQRRCELGRDQRLRRRFEAPAHGVLGWLRRVRLVQRVPEEEPEEVS